MVASLWLQRGRKPRSPVNSGPRSSRSPIPDPRSPTPDLERTAADHADQREDDRDDEKDVQESAKGVLGDDAQQPQDDEDDYQRDHAASPTDDTARLSRKRGGEDTAVR